MSRFDKVQNHAVNSNTERKVTDRELDNFSHSTVSVRYNDVTKLGINFLDHLEERIKKNKPYVFASPMPVGTYRFEDYGVNYVILKNEKRNTVYLNEVKNWWAVRCNEDRCWGRGFKRTPQKRKSMDQLKAMLGTYEGAPYRPYVEEECRVCNENGLLNEMVGLSNSAVLLLRSARLQEYSCSAVQSAT